MLVEITLNGETDTYDIASIEEFREVVGKADHHKDAEKWLKKAFAYLEEWRAEEEEEEEEPTFAEIAELIDLPFKHLWANSPEALYTQNSDVFWPVEDEIEGLYAEWGYPVLEGDRPVGCNWVYMDEKWLTSASLGDGDWGADMNVPLDWGNEQYEIAIAPLRQVGVEVSAEWAEFAEEAVLLLNKFIESQDAWERFCDMAPIIEEEEEEEEEE